MFIAFFNNIIPNFNIPIRVGFSEKSKKLLNKTGIKEKAGEISKVLYHYTAQAQITRE